MLNRKNSNVYLPRRHFAAHVSFPDRLESVTVERPRVRARTGLHTRGASRSSRRILTRGRTECSHGTGVPRSEGGCSALHCCHIVGCSFQFKKKMRRRKKSKRKERKGRVCGAWFRNVRLASTGLVVLLNARLTLLQISLPIVRAAGAAAAGFNVIFQNTFSCTFSLSASSSSLSLSVSVFYCVVFNARA